MEINLEDPILKNIIMEFIYNDLKMHYFKVFDLEISIFTSSDVDILNLIFVFIEQQVEQKKNQE